MNIAMEFWNFFGPILIGVSIAYVIWGLFRTFKEK